MAVIGNLAILVTANPAGLAQGLGRSQALLATFAQNVASSTDTLGGLALAATKAGIAIAALTAGAFAVKLAADLEETTIAFRVLIGDAKTAGQVLGQLRAYAASTPFQSTELFNAARQLSAYGTNAKQLLPVISMLGDVALATQTPLADLTYLYGTLQTQGRAFARDIYQFAGRGIPIQEELAKVLGVQKQQIMGLVEEGKIGFPEVVKAFKNMTSAGGRFHGMTDELSKTMKGMWNQFTDNAMIALTEFGQLLTEHLDLRSLLRGAIDATDWIRSNMKSIGPVVAFIGSLLKATFVTGLELAKHLVEGIRVAWIGMQEAMPAMGPAIAGWTQAVVDFVKAWSDSPIKIEDTTTAMVAGMAVVGKAIFYVIDTLDYLGESIEMVGKIAFGTVHIIATGFGTAFEVLRAAVTGAAMFIVEVFTTAFRMIQSAIAKYVIRPFLEALRRIVVEAGSVALTLSNLPGGDAFKAIEIEAGKINARLMVLKGSFLAMAEEFDKPDAMMGPAKAFQKTTQTITRELADFGAQAKAVWAEMAANKTLEERLNRSSAMVDDWVKRVVKRLKEVPTNIDAKGAASILGNQLSGNPFAAAASAIEIKAKVKIAPVEVDNIIPKELFDRANELKKEFADPLKKFQDDLIAVDHLFDLGLIKEAQLGGGIGKLLADAEKQVGLGEIKSPTAAVKGTSAAISAEVRFANQTSADPQERIANLLAALQEQSRRQTAAAERLVEVTRRPDAVKIP